MMDQMMQSPLMQQMMSSPELMRSLMMANPQVRTLVSPPPSLFLPSFLSLLLIYAQHQDRQVLVTPPPPSIASFLLPYSTHQPSLLPSLPPQMRALLDANPQLNHILSDPAMLRQAMETARNPAAREQMMRSNVSLPPPSLPPSFPPSLP